MSDHTAIEWTDATWNPVTGCQQIPGPHGAPSGCDNCYAKRLNDTRLMANPQSARFGIPFETVLTHPDRLMQPLKWKRPRRIFVNSLSDLFHVDVPREFIDKVFAIMSLAPQHTFQILTKRPDRMRSYMDGLGNRYLDIEDAAVALGEECGIKDAYERYYRWLNAYHPNVWLGTSICSNVDAWRADVLRKTPAALRFLSIEPMLGPVDEVSLDGIQWVICGGESGPGARPMHPWWVRDLRDRCVAAGVPFFFKQWGEWAPISDLVHTEHLYYPAPERNPEAVRRCKVPTDVLQLDGSIEFAFPKGAMQIFRLGKKRAGRDLDGRTWDEFPAPKAVLA